jgi:selenocysteine lyase/cysteine desulfurase
MDKRDFRRDFLRGVGGCTLGALLGANTWARWAVLPAAELAQATDFWAELRSKYRINPDYINLENGYYSMLSQPVLEAFVGRVREVNYEAAHFMRVRAAEERLASRKELARVAGCGHDEVAITRNTTESLDAVIAGFDWKAGDEAVMAEQDYGTMLEMFDQQARRHGIVCRRVSLPLDPQSDEELVELYASAITERTRLLMVCHMVNITGQILPVAKIADMAHSRGVAVMVDGAHAFAHIEFRMADLHCDYYGASLHKWLGCPLGAGLLWVRNDRIAGLWPLLAPSPKAADDIERLSHSGTHPAHTDLALRDAIAFHESIGIARKEARLRHLQQHWTSRVRGRPRIRLNTPADPRRSCAIANVGVDGLTPPELAKRLFDEHRIYTVAIERANVHGVRITPHVFTSEAELDALVRALLAIAA